MFTVGPPVLLFKWNHRISILNILGYNGTMPLHFLLPLSLIPLAGGHILALHDTGSSNPLGIHGRFDKVPFGGYFTVKDLYVWRLLIGCLTLLALLAPWYLGDPENFSRTIILVTPSPWPLLTGSLLGLVLTSLVVAWRIQRWTLATLRIFWYLSSA